MQLSATIYTKCFSKAIDSYVISIYFVLFRDDFAVNESVKSIELFWLLRERLERHCRGLLKSY